MPSPARQIMGPMRKTIRRLEHDQALDIGLSALSFLAEERNRLVRFLDLTGMDPDELRMRAQTPVVLAAVLDHMLGDESMLLVFTATTGLDPEVIGQARDLLQRSA